MNSAPAWVDTHCHLDAAEFSGDRESVVRAAQAAAVDTIVVPAVARGNFSAVTELCRTYPGCVAAYGIHPLYVDRAVDADLPALRRCLEDNPAVAVGEIGLDFFVQPYDQARQEHFFGEQLKLAREMQLPVLLHVRRAVDAVLKQLRRIGAVGGIAHAFNGSAVQAQQFIDLGFKLGFGGAATHDRATRLRELARTLPLDAMVLETDAPDIAPAWLAGGRNQPAELPRIGATIAVLRGLTAAQLAAATSANARAVLPGLIRFEVGNHG